MNNYDNVDYCLNLLNEFVYNKKKEKFILKEKKNILLIDLKKDKQFNFLHIFKSKHKYLFRNKNVLIYKRYNNQNSLIHITKYDLGKNNNINDMNRKELNDMLFTYKISQLFISENINLLLFPIMNFDIKFNELINNKKY